MLNVGFVDLTSAFDLLNNQHYRANLIKINIQRRLFRIVRTFVPISVRIRVHSHGSLMDPIPLRKVVKEDYLLVLFSVKFLYQ